MIITRQNISLNVTALGDISKDEFIAKYKSLFIGNIEKLWIEIIELQGRNIEQEFIDYESINTPKESIEDNNGQDSQSKSRKPKSSKSSRSKD